MLTTTQFSEWTTWTGPLTRLWLQWNTTLPVTASMRKISTKPAINAWFTSTYSTLATVSVRRDRRFGQCHNNSIDSQRKDIYSRIMHTTYDMLQPVSRRHHSDMLDCLSVCSLNSQHHVGQAASQWHPGFLGRLDCLSVSSLNSLFMSSQRCIHCLTAFFTFFVLQLISKFIKCTSFMTNFCFKATLESY